MDVIVRIRDVRMYAITGRAAHDQRERAQRNELLL